MRKNVALALTALLALAGAALVAWPTPPRSRAPGASVAARRGAEAARRGAEAPPGRVLLRVQPGSGGEGEPQARRLAAASRGPRSVLAAPATTPAPRADEEAAREGAARVAALCRAALEGSPATKDEAFDALCGLSLEREDLAAELREALLRVADAGLWPAATLRFLPMAGASAAEIGRLGVALTSADPEVRRAALGALGRADAESAALLELEVAFSREADPVAGEELAAAALRVARGEAPALLERLLATPPAHAAALRPVLLAWREALRAGDLAPSEVYAAGDESGPVPRRVAAPSRSGL